MAGFGKCSGGGRRIAAREQLPLPAVVSTLKESVTAEVVDLSASGVRFKAAHLPGVGALVALRIDRLDAFGSVAWCEGELCGVAFDVPLSNLELTQLRREVNIASVVWRSVDERLAARDWRHGIAR